MSEEEQSPKVRSDRTPSEKPGSPKAVKKSEVGSPKSEGEHSARNNYREDTSHSAINKSERRSPLEHLEKANNGEKIEQSKSEIKMEVHHHPQLHHGKKPWKEYFLEGLMIFLAVMMGFFAESYRERISDRAKEHEYMESLVRDLASDTVALKAGFPVKEARVKAIDSVFLFFEGHPEPKTIPLTVYRNIRRTWWDRLYTRNTGTINQLRNAGGLRLIRRTEVRDSLASYDWLWGRLDYNREVYFANQQLEGTMIEKLVNANDLLHSYRLNSTGRQLFPALSDSSVIRINTDGLSEFLNFLSRQKGHTLQDEERYRQLEKEAVVLITMIKKEYDLE